MAGPRRSRLVVHFCVCVRAWVFKKAGMGTTLDPIFLWERVGVRCWEVWWGRPRPGLLS